MIIISGIGNELTKVAEANRLKKEAKEAYTSGDYKTAISKYHYLLDSMHLDDDQIRLNLSNAYFNINDTAQSVNYYNSLVNSPKADIRSLAHQQLGIVDTQRKQYQEALQRFKQSLKANPANEDARYNYELLKKLIEEQKKQEEQPQDQKKRRPEKSGAAGPGSAKTGSRATAAG